MPADGNDGGNKMQNSFLAKMRTMTIVKCIERNVIRDYLLLLRAHGRIHRTIYIVVCAIYNIHIKYARTRIQVSSS